jgi:hypothetical protein
LALLLASFSSNVFNEKEDDENKIGEAIDRIQRFFHLFHRKTNASLSTTQELVLNLPLSEDIEMQPMNIISSPTLEILHMPSNCCAKCIPKLIEERWTYLRSLAQCLVKHRFFEWFIIISILVSSITLVS